MTSRLNDDDVERLEELACQARLAAAVRHDELRRASTAVLNAWGRLYPRAAFHLGADPDFARFAASMTVLRRHSTPNTAGGEGIR